MTNELVLPEEVSKLADCVSVEKRSEVQNVLNSVFQGVSKMRTQLESITVEDENDKTSMKLANTLRLSVRNVRLDAEKVFDSKRSEVQEKMISFKAEDGLWLKAKQTMQLLTKEIEELAKYKEDTAIRIETERKQLRTQKRINDVSKFAEVSISDFENMSDENFSIFLSGIEKAFNDKVEADKKAEADRIAKEKADKEERQRVLQENERLKKESEEKERQLKIEREKQAEMIAKQKADADAVIKKQQEENAEKLRIEKEKADKLAKELQDKKDLDAKQEKERIQKEEADKKDLLLAQKKAKNAPDKEKLLELAETLKSLSMPTLKSEESQKILKNTEIMIEKLCNYIKENAETL